MTEIARRDMPAGIAVAGGAIAAMSARAGYAAANLSKLKTKTDIACVPRCDFVPSVPPGVAALAELQATEFAYIKVG